MPQADLKYSADLDIDAAALLAAVEATILQVDPNSRKCKGRAYPTEVFHHTNLVLEVALLQKPHRDQAFTDELIAKLESLVETFLPGPCEFALKLSYNPLTAYRTKFFSPE